MELSSDGLAGQKATLTDQEFATLVKCSACEYDLLGAIFEKSAVALLQEAEQEAHKAGAQTLLKVSQSVTIRIKDSYQAKSDNKCDISFLTRSGMVASHFIPCTGSTGPVHARNGQCQETSNDTASEDVVQPRSAPVEEEAEGKQTCAHCDACSTEYMRPAEVQAVVRGAVVSKVMHFSDGCTSTDTAHDERHHPDGGMLASLVEAVRNHQSEEDNNDRDDSG